jgi:outer membrane protein W
MKHTFTLVFFVVAISAFGQTEKGNSFISGNISTGYSATAYPKEALRKSNYSFFSMGVSYGKFIKDNIVWRTDLNGGITRIFDRSSLGAQTTSVIHPNTTLSLSSVGLYYFGKGRWKGFIGGGINVYGNFYKTKNTETGSALPHDYTQKNSGLAIKPLFEVGALYFFSKHLALQLSATANSFPINTAGLSTGLFYWVKPTSFEVESKELSTLQKGRWMLGAGFGVNTSRYENTEPNNSYTATRNFDNGNLSLQIGKFIKNRTMVGANLGYSTGKEVQFYNSGQKTTNYSTNYNVGIFLKKYLLPTRFSPYFGIDISYNRAANRQVSDNSGNSSSQNNNYGLGSRLGLAYIINTHFLVETQLAELYAGHTVETKQWGGGLNAGLRPNLSLSYIF